MLRKTSRGLALALLFASLTFAQTAPAPAAGARKPAARKPAAPSAAKPAGKPAELAPNAPVMFVSGLCALRGANVPANPVPPPPGAKPGECVRAVTRAQFERLVAGMGPRAAAADKTQLAEYYVRALLIDNEARKLKLDQDPAVAEAIWMGRIGALGNALHEHFQKKFANLPESEITQYYEQHKDEFDEATVRRVVVPKPPQQAKIEKPAEAAKPGETAPDSPSAAAKTPAEPAAPEVPYEQLLAARKAYAEKLLARARAGEDLDAIQKDAFTSAKIEAQPPDTNPVALHRGQLPPAHEEKVFALQANQYTPLIEEPNAYFFYKVEKRRTVPLTEARDEIRTQLINQKEEDAIKAVFMSGRPQLNPAYFAAPQPQAPPAAPGESAPKPPQTPPGSTAPEAPPAAPATQQPEQAAPAAQPPQETTPPAQPPPEPPKTEAPAEPPK